MKGKTMKTVIIALVCIAAGFAAAWIFLPASSDTGPKKAEASNEGQLYTCGMHPEIISDEPGICPICNMKLTPKRDSGDETGTVRISPATKQNMGLVTVPARYKPIVRSLTAFGKAAVAEPNIYRLTVKTDGWVERLMVAEEGEKVAKGQPLLEIYSPGLVTTQKELLVALKSPDNPSMKRLAEAARQRLLNWDISEDQLTRLIDSGDISRTMVLRSPADGIVRSKNVAEGDRISARSTLYEIVDLSHIWIEANVYEQNLPFVDTGMTARVSIPSLPGQSFEGRLDYLSPVLDRRGQAEMRLALNNPGYRIRPEMYAEVSIESALDGDRLSVPRTAVINSGLRQLVFVAESESSYRPRQVTTGAVGSDDRIEIIEGLAEGEAVVVSGQFLLDSETRLNEAIDLGNHSHDHSSEKRDDHPSHDDSNDHSSPDDPDDPYDIHTCPMPSHFHVLEYGPGQCPECGMDLVPVSETENSPVYVCPMPQCGTVSQEPGKCPVCNMNLVEYEAGVAYD